MQGGGTTTTTQKSDPWSGAQPYLTDLMSKAQQTYDASQGQNQLPPTYAGPSATTQNALQDIVSRAQNGSPLINTADQSLSNVLQPRTAPGADTLQSLLSGYNDPGNAYAQAGAGSNAALGAAGGVGGSLAQMGASGPNIGGSESLLSNLANSGPNVGGSASVLAGLSHTQTPGAAQVNPYLDQMFSAASKPVIDTVNAQAGAAGRTGSGAQQQLLTRNLGDLAANMYGQNYAQEQQIAQNQQGLNQGAASALGNLGLGAYGAQTGAANSLGNLGLGAFGAQSSALGNAANILSGLGENQASRQLQAGNQLSSNALNQAGVQAGAANALNSQFNTQNAQSIQGAAVAPTLAGQDYTDLQNMLTAGGAYDTQAQNQLNSILNQFQYSQQQPWNILSGYSGAISGLGGLGGSSTGTTTQPSQSLIPSLLGAGVSAATNPLGLFGFKLW